MLERFMAKSESWMESNRIKSAINSTKKSLDLEIMSLGQKVYYDWRSGAFDINKLIRDLENIAAMEREMEESYQRLEQIKIEESQMYAMPPSPAGRFCPSCGRPLLDGCRFCDGCGTPVAY